MELIDTFNDLSSVRMSADATATSNGDGAKTAKVQIVARTGDPATYGGLGRIVHDFSGMSAPNKVPLDWEHGDSIADGIGWLNRFDAATGDLVCSGAILVSDDDTQKLVTNMVGGVPYQASIDHAIDDDTVVEFVPEGTTALVNGQEIAGPLTVFREWALRAVALCKYGIDPGTSAQVLMSKKENPEPKKGILIRFAKQTGMQVNNTNHESVKADDAKAVEAPVETVAAPAPVVDPVVKADEKTVVEQSAETPGVVEAEKVEPVVAPAVEQVQMSADPRKEFTQFLSDFGPEKAAFYFSEGLSHTAASLRFAKDVVAERDDLKKRLAALDRGAEKPVKMSKATVDEKSPEKPNLIKFAGK